MEPIDEFHSIFYTFIYRFQLLVGVGVLGAGYRPNRVTCFWFAINASFMGCVWYTLLTYDTDTQWKCLSFFGLTCQGLTKFVVVCSRPLPIQSNVQFLRRIYAANRKPLSTGRRPDGQRPPSPSNYETLQKWSAIAKRTLLVGTVLICTSIGFFVLEVGVENWWFGRREPVMYVFLPGVDETSSLGYWTLTAYHCCTMFLGAVGTCAADLILVMMVVHIWPMAFIFRDMFGQLNGAMAGHSTRNVHSAEMDSFVRNLVCVHQDICRYIQQISDIFFYIIFVEIFSVALTLCTLIFCMLTMTWNAQYFLLMMMMFKLFTYCLFGTLVEMTMDLVYGSIVLSDWYKLSIKHQMLIKLMVLRAQKPTVLKAGTLPLNLDTFVNVLKSVYSVGMILIESVQ